MKITRKNQDTGTLLSAIPVGSCFLDFEGQVCMKIAEVVRTERGEHLNVVLLATGRLAGFDQESYVKIVNTELIVEG